MTKFDFTEEEVQLNKKGILSARQKEVRNAMAGSMRSSSKGGIWVILGFSALGICIWLAVFLQSMDEQKLRTLGPQVLIGLCLMLVSVLVITILSVLYSHWQAAKVENAPLYSAEGPIRHDTGSSENIGRFYYVYFGKKRFSFPNDMSHVFPEGSTFRIFYCKVGQIELIMSFERIS